MAGLVWAYGRKAVSWVLTFNCLLSIMLAVGLLSGFYAAHWRLYQPYLLNANLFWAAILVSIMNFFPTANLGRVKVRRLGFHHFVYGLAILAASVTLIMFMPIPLMNLFKLYVRDVDFNVGRVFILVGLTLIIDDFADVSNMTTRALRFVKSKVYQSRRMIHVLQCFLFCIILYIFLCVTTWLILNPRGVNLPNLVIDGTLLVTSLTAFGSVDKKIWLRITPQPS
jgi:hypothetical protein